MRRLATILFAVLVLFPFVTTNAQASNSAGIYVNMDDFTSTCGAASSAPATSNAQAKAALTALGYSPVSDYYGASFTRSTFLSSFPPTYAVYVHSHGDTYNISPSPTKDAAFLQDPGTGKCNGASAAGRVYSVPGSGVSDSIKQHAIPVYTIVVMSTCKLGQEGRVKHWVPTADGKYAYVETGSSLPENTMPGAFGFAMNSNGTYTKTATSAEFYMGYVYYTLDSSQTLF